MKRFLLYICIVLLLASCKHDDSSPLVVFFSDKYDALTPVDGNTEIYFVINVVTNGVNVTRLQLEQNDGTGTKLIVDSVPQPQMTEKETRKFNIKYTTGSYPKLTLVSLTCRVMTVEGEMAEVKKHISVSPADIQWIVQESVAMYSAASGRKYGYSLPLRTIVFPEAVEQDTLLFYDRLPQSDDEQAEVSSEMTRSWESKKGIYFARFESLDFSNNNAAAIEQAYSLAAHDNVIMDIKNDDVIILGSKTEVYGLVKIILVADEEDKQNDRYVFSIKMRNNIVAE